MNPEVAELEKQAFVSEHRAFAEKEGYDVLWDDYQKKWFVHTPRKLRPGEKHQYFQNIAGAWEVAAIRAGRKIGGEAPKNLKMRPELPHDKQPKGGKKPKPFHDVKDVFK